MNRLPVVPEQKSLGEVSQQPDTVTVSKDQLKRAANALASGARLLQQIAREGDEVTVAANVGRVAKLRTKLGPVVRMASEAVQQAREIAGDAAVELAKLVALRGRVSLPHHDAADVTTAWQRLIDAENICTSGIESFERLVRQGESMLQLPSVSEYDEQNANELVRDLGYAASFPEGVRRALDMAKRVMDVVHNGEPEITTEQAEVGALSYIMAPPKATKSDDNEGNE